MMSLLIKSVLFTVLVPGTVAIFFPLHIADEANIGQGFNLFIAALFIGLGLAIYSACVWNFITQGFGTPAPIDAPKRLVTQGIYRYARNPMYVAVVIIIVGWAILFSDLMIVLYGGIAAFGFQCFIVFYEEPRLQQLFGSEYNRYKTAVNRWLPNFSLMKNDTESM